jgi:hypothetical protein
MKKIVIAIFAIVATVFVSCNDSNNSSDKKAMASNDSMAMDKQSSSSTDTSKTPVIQASFANADPAVKNSVTEIVTHYMHVKNSLINSDASEAKSGANMIVETIKKADKSMFPAEQKKEYDKHVDAIKEHAQMISSAKDVEEQRKHFAELSNHVYELVKAFGGGKTLYHDHCPMYNNGSEWLSETKEIKNPYMSPGMPTCGRVEEILQ